MAGWRECKDARTVKATENHGQRVMDLRRSINTFYEHFIHEPELRELDLSLPFECLTGLARHGRKAYSRRAGLETFVQCYVWRMQLCHGRS
jgi:hypothetical protein